MADNKKEKKVVLFTTSIGSSIQTKKAQQSLRWLLEKKGIDFTEFDVFLDPKAREDLLQKTNEPSLSSLASSNPLPLLFFDDKLIGGFEQVEKLEEDDLLATYLK